MLIVNSFIGYVVFHLVVIIMHSVVTQELIHHINVACGRHVVREGSKGRNIMQFYPTEPLETKR